MRRRDASRRSLTWLALALLLWLVGVYLFSAKRGPDLNADDAGASSLAPASDTSSLHTEGLATEPDRSRLPASTTQKDARAKEPESYRNALCGLRG